MRALVAEENFQAFLHAHFATLTYIEEHDGERVRLYLVEHMIPAPQNVAEGQKLDDPELYVELAQLADFSKDEL